MLSESSWDCIAQLKTLCNVIQEALDNIAKEKNHVQCCLNTFETTLHRKKSCSMLPKYFWDNIAPVNPLWNAVQESPDNIVH